jgi:hypothetical protein
MSILQQSTARPETLHSASGVMWQELRLLHEAPTRFCVFDESISFNLTTPVIRQKFG